MSESVNTMSIQKFRGDNYATWKVQMKALMLAKNVWSVVSGEEKVEANADEKQKAAWCAKNNIALAQIVLAVAPSHLHYVSDQTDAQVAWNILKDNFSIQERAGRIYLKRRLYAAEMKDDENILEHINKIKQLSHKLAEVGAQVAEEDVAICLLKSLPKRYSLLVSQVEASEKELTLDYLTRLLVNEHVKETETSRVRSKSGISALKAEQKKRPGRCNNCGEKGHWARECPKKNSGDTKSFGKNPSMKRSFNKGDKFQSHIADVKEDDEASLFTATLNNASVCTASRRTAWIMDSGASHHMTGVKSLFSDYEEKEGGLIRLGNDCSVKVQGRGKVPLTLDINGETQVATMTDVLFVPDLAYNLFSIPAALKSNQYSCEFSTQSCVIRRKSDGKVALIGDKVDNMYYVRLCPEKSCHVAKSESLQLWHERLGHLGYDAVVKLVKEDLVTGVNLSENMNRPDHCESCYKGRMSRFPFRGSEVGKSRVPLELIHTDICGPMETESLGGAKYFVTFIDDATAFASVYMMSQRSEVSEKFRKFIQWAKTQTGRKVKSVRHDGAKEYTQGKFAELCSQLGIEQQCTVPYSPQQNGIAERINRTLCERARSMLQHAGLPKDFWAEAVSNAANLRNRCPVSWLKGKTPYEAWTKSKPNLSHVKVFGCKAWCKVPDETRKKWDPKAQSAINLGLVPGTKGYKLYVPETGAVILSRDVAFDESSFPYRVEDQVVDLDIVEPAQVPEEQPVSVQDTEEESSSDVPQPEPEIPVSSLRRLQPVRRSKIEHMERFVAGQAHVASGAQDDEPSSYKEAMQSSDAVRWNEAMTDELKSLKERETYEVCTLPQGRKAIGSRWVFKRKLNPDGSVARYKARLVAKGFSQKY